MARPVSRLSEFILSLPRTMTATAVADRAAAEGFKTTASNVYRVRRSLGAREPGGRTPGAKGEVAVSRKASDLPAVLRTLAVEFAVGVVRAIRASPLCDLEEISLTGRRSPGRPRTSGARAWAPRTTAGSGRSPRVAERVDAVVAAIAKAPGAGAVQIREATGLGQAEIVRPIKLALEAGRIRKKGERRETVYFPVG